ncbi:MAG: hypothetical protein ABI462_04695 [Ignavibacteria bacterium]
MSTLNDFALVPLGTINDLRITMINSSRNPRPGFDIRYEIIYRNVGTTILAGSVDMVYDSEYNYLPGNASPVPTSYNSGTYTFSWDYTDLKPGEVRKINITFNLPSTIPLSTPVLMNATIFPITGDNVAADNAYTMNEIVRGSFDPNDITVEPAGNITPQEVYDEEPLTYTIRFQNTGTAEAINIKVIDTLSPGMNVPAIEMIAASHDYSLKLTEGNIAEWRFTDIMLPDSTADEPGSHGFIRFRIKPKTDLVLGDNIKSTAYIYFDFNEPVITNTVVTSVQNPQKKLSLYWNNHTMFPVRDTAAVYLRSASAPYEVIDSGQIYPESLAQFYSGYLGIDNALSGSSYYIVLKHRNSIETWSANPVEIQGDTTHYDFTSSVSQAYGNNMYDVDGIASFYSGDPDQSGQADLHDLLEVFNDSKHFLAGYNSTDLNGDNVVNLADLTAEYNFTQLFAKTVRP